ncbi:MAG: hypothetical protein CMO55_12025 [Verrucomicrobiales bacterium]|nr:hypothetical protein [Verrucomicrobiales bacterium]
MKTVATLCGLTAMLFATVTRAEERPTFDSVVDAFLVKYCLDCHDADTEKGDVALDDIFDVTAENAEIWKSVWEQVSLKEMPPRDKKNQPTAMERLELANWITSELEVAMADVGGFYSHKLPKKANHLPHELLFGDEVPKDLEPASTPARIWRIHPQEHLVRLNALINIDPEYNPEMPGQRTAGDRIPWNEQGEVKVYYGLDRLQAWVGGTAAYAAAITGFPPVLTTTNDHGLRNYPIMYSVNGAEATQIAALAEDVVRFMANGPIAEPWQFDAKQRQQMLQTKYKGMDIRGTVQSLQYGPDPKRPLTPVYDLVQDETVSQENLRAAVVFLFENLTGRPPTDDETDEYVTLANDSIENLGKDDGVILGLVPIFLDPDALFRPELADYGKPDEYGRVMLQDWELGLAVNAAFSFLPPDKELKQAVLDGKMKTRKDVEREVQRILDDDAFRKPRILQFFREYFDYDRAGRICKDTGALRKAGYRERNYTEVMNEMTANTDRLVELILEEDKQVLRELLTTDRVVWNPGKETLYYSTFENLKEPPKPDKDPKKRKPPTPQQLGHTILPNGETVHVRVAEEVARYRKNSPKVSERVLTHLPKGQRLGILTHPSWLVSHTDAMDNHAIHRGIWVRERLLGDATPDVPITVDAMLPDEPNNTLRHRMRVTREAECWRCHRKMDPLGLPFEQFNHIGLYRTTEHGKPVNTRGEIFFSGDPELDGPVKGPYEMIRKLAASERVEQVFVRHAFRYWIGRNETVNDAPVLQAAWHAYHDNNGSMKALIESLVTSDAFLYRTVEEE